MLLLNVWFIGNLENPRKLLNTLYLFYCNTIIIVAIVLINNVRYIRHTEEINMLRCTKAGLDQCRTVKRTVGCCCCAETMVT